MKVFKIQNDGNHYQYFLGRTNEDDEILQMDGTPKLESWKAPNVLIYMPKLKRGDFFQFASNHLITSPRATEALRNFLEMSGELLPVPYKGEEYTLLNVTECIDCLDQDKCEWLLNKDTGERIYPLKYVFRRGWFTESPLFKIPESCAREVLLVEGMRNPDQEFRAVVERNGLKGLRYTLLWSDDD
jgi:hypothetical protein